MVYNGGGHNGVDFKYRHRNASNGLKEGVVAGVGTPTSLVPGSLTVSGFLYSIPTIFPLCTPIYPLSKCPVTCRLKHTSLSGIVEILDTLPAYHLHYGVFASEGIEIKSYKSKICNTNMILPVKTKTTAYLNPLSYL